MLYLCFDVLNGFVTKKMGLKNVNHFQFAGLRLIIEIVKKIRTM